MALTVGDLVVNIRGDDGSLQRALTESELRMAGFQRSSDGRLRDMRGRFASESNAMGRELGRLGDNDGPDRSSRKMRGMISAAGAVGSALTSLPALIAAGIPAAAGLAAALVNIAPAAAIGATAVLSLAQATAAIKIGTSGVGAAITAAFAPATGGAGAATGAANQYAQAQRALKDAISNAAYANKQAVQQVASAERSLTDAQKAARQAQLDLTQARKDATRQLQDQNNSLADAQLNQRQAVMDAAAAEQNLNAVKALGVGATQDQIDQAQLAYDQAQQHLAEQTLDTQRLTDDTAAANKAGVEGSQTVVDAKQKISDANQNVSDQEQALANAREQQARTAAQGLESIQQAQEALTTATAGSAGGVNALAAAMAKLSPNAQAFVRQIIALKPAWDALKMDVQDALFKGLAGTLKNTATSVMPVLHKELTNSASALNDMAKGAMNSAKQLADSGVLGQAMHSASTGLHNLSGIPGVVVTALGQLAAAAGPSFEKLTSAMGKAAGDIGKKLTEMFKSGAMQDAIEQAVNLIKDLMEVGGNVFSIIGSIFKSAQANGGTFIDTLKTITGQLANTFASPAVQGGLMALFSTISTLAKTAAPLLDQALRAIGPVLTALGPPVKTLIEALGKALQPVIKALGPVLVEAAKAVGNLVVAFAPLLPVIGDVIAQLLPTLTPVLKTLADVFILLAPVIGQVADAIGPILTPIIAGLGDILSQFVSQYAAMFMKVLQQLIPLIPQLIPVVIQLAESFGQILTQLAPLLPQIMLLASQFIVELLPAILPLVPPALKLAEMFIKIATSITVHAIGALEKIVGWFKDMKEKMQPAIDAVKHVAEWIAQKFEWLADHLVGHSVIPDMINSIVRWFAGLPGKAWNALSSFGSRIAGRASDAGAAMVSAIRGKLTSAVSWINGLPGRARDALGDLSGYLYKSGQSLISGFINGLKSMAGAAGNAALDLLSNVRNYFPFSPAKKGPFSGQGWTSYSGAAMATALAAGIASGEGVVSSAALSLMGTAQRGLTGAGPMGNLVTAPNAGSTSGTVAGAGGASGSSGQPVTGRIVIDVTGADAAWKRVIREIVRTDGRGDVQMAFGQAI